MYPQGPREWVMVFVSGRWYHIDFTWNDPVKVDNPLPYAIRQDGSGTVSLNYFLRSDDEISINHIWPEMSEHGFLYPKADESWSGNEDPIIDVTQPIPTPLPTPTFTPFPDEGSIPTITPDFSESSSDHMSLPDDISDSGNPGGSGSAFYSSQKTEYSDAISQWTSDSMTDYSGIRSADERSVVKKSDPKVAISGFLTDSAGDPVKGIRMVLYATDQSAITDDNGAYYFGEVKVGSYKIQLYDENNEMIAEMPIIITFGDRTVQTDGSVTVKGGKLNMDLVINDGVLTIKQVSSPSFDITTTTAILIIASVSLIIGTVVLTLLRKNRQEGT